jgi:hypothetical protein
MVKDKLPFEPSTAQRLMAIARNRVLSNRAHAHVLPPSWMTALRADKARRRRLELAVL